MSYKIELDKTPAIKVDEHVFKTPDIEVKGYHFPETWKPVLGGFDKPRAFLFIHHNTAGKYKNQIWWHDVSVWCKTREDANRFIEENGVDLSKTAYHRATMSENGWIVDYI